MQQIMKNPEAFLWLIPFEKSDNDIALDCGKMAAPVRLQFIAANVLT